MSGELDKHALDAWITREQPEWEPDIGDEITCVTEGVDEWADGRVGVVMDEHAFFKSTWWVAVERDIGVSTVIALGLDQMEPTP